MRLVTQNTSPSAPTTIGMLNSLAQSELVPQLSRQSAKRNTRVVANRFQRAHWRMIGPTNGAAIAIIY